jgi:hypothetical protein
MKKTGRGRMSQFTLAAGMLLAACVVLGAGPLPQAWRNWHYSRAIELPAADAARLVTIVVPEDVFARSRTTLPDLRVIDDQGQETPFAIRIHDGSANVVSAQTTLVEQSFVPGQYTQIVLDLGKRTPFHNAVEIQTGETDFIEWVSVEASDDAHLWRVVQPRAPFFLFHLQYHEGAQTIPYSENNAEYLRIHILDGAKQFPVSGANVFHKTTIPPERVPLSQAFEPGPASTPERSAWIADFGAVGVPVSEVRFDVPPPTEFIRTVEVFASDDGKTWNRFAQGEIYRYYQGETSQEQLTVWIPFGGAQGRYWKAEVVNGNDAPLQGATLRMYAAPRHGLFEQQPGRNYRLIYGQARAQSPEYDLDRRLEAKQEDAATAGQVGPEEENPDYSDPQPWTEKNAYVLWIVVGIAVLLLGYAAIKSLRKSGAIPASDS